MTAKYGEYECLNGAFLKSLDDTMLLKILALIYKRGESTLRSWKNMQGVVRELPRSLPEFQLQKKPGERCEFRYFERYHLMKIMLMEKVRDKIRELW